MKPASPGCSSAARRWCFPMWLWRTPGLCAFQPSSCRPLGPSVRLTTIGSVPVDAVHVLRGTTKDMHYKSLDAVPEHMYISSAPTGGHTHRLTTAHQNRESGRSRVRACKSL